MLDENNLPETFKEMTTANNLFCQFDELNGVLLLDIKSDHLNSDDFLEVSKVINSYYADKGELAGIIINSKKFPHWKDARNREEYMDFAKNHHHKFKKAAVNMGGFFAMIVVGIGKGRVHPEIKKFKHNQIFEAQEWILS